MRRFHEQAFSLFAFQDIITSVCGIVVLITLLLALELATRVLGPEDTARAESQSSYEAMRQEYNQLHEKIDSTRSALAQNALFEEELVTSSVSDLQERLQKLDAALVTGHENLTDAESQFQNAQRRREQSAVHFEELSQLETEQRQLEIKNDQLRQKGKALVLESKQVMSGNKIYFGRSDSVREFPWLVDISADRIVVYPLGVSETAPVSREFPAGSGDAAREFLLWAKTRDAHREYFILLIRPSGIGHYYPLRETLTPTWRIGIDFIGQSQEIEFLPQEPKP